MKIGMFVYNNFTRDARVLKEASTLVAAGHEVVIVAVLDKTTVPGEERDGIRVVRIDRRPLHYRLLWTVRGGRRRGRGLRPRGPRPPPPAPRVSPGRPARRPAPPPARRRAAPPGGPRPARLPRDP